MKYRIPIIIFPTQLVAILLSSCAGMPEEIPL